MFRLSRTKESVSAVTFTAEGLLVGDWVEVLEIACTGHLRARRRVELEFAGVSFVDREGIRVLQELVARGATIVHPTPLVEDLLRGPNGD